MADQCKSDLERCQYDPIDWSRRSLVFPALEPVGTGGGYSCMGDDCDADALFLVKIKGPAPASDVDLKRFTVALIGGGIGYNCGSDKFQKVTTPYGVEVHCILGMKHGVRLSSIAFRVIDGYTQVVAYQANLADVAPDLPWP